MVHLRIDRLISYCMNSSTCGDILKIFLANFHKYLSSNAFEIVVLSVYFLTVQCIKNKTTIRPLGTGFCSNNQFDGIKNAVCLFRTAGVPTKLESGHWSSAGGVLPFCWSLAFSYTHIIWTLTIWAILNFNAELQQPVRTESSSIKAELQFRLNSRFNRTPAVLLL